MKWIGDMANKSCCGSVRVTAFCPDCGTQLRESNDLKGLVSECRKQAESHKKRADMATEYIESKNFSNRKAEYWDKTYKSSNRKFMQWTAWADTLESLLQAGTKT